MSQNVIELNGKRYDALTGAFLGKSDSAAVPVSTPRRQGPGRAIDGFIRPSARPKAPPQPTVHHVPAAAKAAHAITHTATNTPSEPLPTAVQHHAGHAHLHAKAKNVQRHQPEHSKTLMRRTVHKPAIQMKPAIKPQSPAETLAAAIPSTLAKRSVLQIDPVRQERARAALKHAAVQRFNLATAGLAPDTYRVKTSGPIPVIAVQPQPLSSYGRATSPIHAPHADMFEHALKHARSHEQPPLKKRHIRHSRVLNIAAGVAAFVVLGGFIAYLNMANIQLRVASAEAGFHASMPSYKPTGYTLRGGVHNQGGAIAMRFTSGDSSFSITQQSSSWDSQALLDNTLALNGDHQTIQQGGRTIFIYRAGNSANAAWVTGNVRYDITGNANLTADQLADIAASM